MIATIKPRDVGKTRRRLAVELIVELEGIDKKIKTVKQELRDLIVARESPPDHQNAAHHGRRPAAQSHRRAIYFDAKKAAGKTSWKPCGPNHYSQWLEPVPVRDRRHRWTGRARFALARSGRAAVIGPAVGAYIGAALMAEAVSPVL
jgi:hypothetical protein